MLDASNMRGLLDDFPVQCRKAMTLAKGVVVPKKKHIIVCGMGGSAIAGDILTTYLSGTLPITVVRDYALPTWVDESCLVLALSYSGNTEETLACFDQATAQHAQVLAITSGGKLKERAKQHVIIPSGLPPRSAVGYLFFPLLGILHNSGMVRITNTELNEMLELLNNPILKEHAEHMAKKLHDKVPLFYASQRLAVLPYRLKTQINENAKQPAFCHIVPEMNHNELVGYKHMRREQFVAVFLRDKDDHPRIQERMTLNKQHIERFIDVVDYDITGTSLLAKLFSTIYWGDYLSYHLALWNREDPTPVTVITQLKKALGE